MGWRTSTGGRGTKELREDLTSFAIENLCLFGGVVFATYGHDALDLVQYVQDNIDPLGKYRGDVELRLLAHMLGRPICVLFDAVSGVLLYSPPEGSSHAYGPAITLCHRSSLNEDGSGSLNRGHYSSVAPKQVMWPHSFPPCPCISNSLASVHGGIGGADSRSNCSGSNQDRSCGNFVGGGGGSGDSETQCGTIGGVLRLANNIWRNTHRFDDHGQHSKMQALVKRQPLHIGTENRNTMWEKRYWMNFVSFNVWSSSSEKNIQPPWDERQQYSSSNIAGGRGLGKGDQMDKVINKLG